MATNSYVIDVTEATFASAVVEQSKRVPVVIDFWAAWCGPCRVLGPILERLAKEMRGAFVLAKIDVDTNQRLAQQFGVQGIPAVKAVHNGRLVDQFEGALPESQVRAWLKRFLPQNGAAGEEEIDEHADPQAAIARYRTALQAEPDSAATLLALGRLLMLQGDPESSSVLGRIKPGVKEHAEAQTLLGLSEFLTADQTLADGGATGDLYRQAASGARAGNWDSSLDGLLMIVQRDRAWGDDAARKAMLGIFTLLGDRDPRVVQYRRKLANALF